LVVASVVHSVAVLVLQMVFVSGFASAAVLVDQSLVESAVGSGAESVDTWAYLSVAQSAGKSRKCRILHLRTYLCRQDTSSKDHLGSQRSGFQHNTHGSLHIHHLHSIQCTLSCQKTDRRLPACLLDLSTRRTRRSEPL